MSLSLLFHFFGSSCLLPAAFVCNSGDVTLEGRIVLNLWRLFKQEVKTTKYTVHGLAASLLGITFPCYSFYTLSSWWNATLDPNMEEATNEDAAVEASSVKLSAIATGSMSRPLRFRCLRYILRYLELTLKLLDNVDLLSRSEEIARLFGTDIASVMSRGSQHRVEAMMCRAAHALGYLLHTASKEQVRTRRRRFK